MSTSVPPNGPPSLTPHQATLLFEMVKHYRERRRIALTGRMLDPTTQEPMAWDSPDPADARGLSGYVCWMQQAILLVSCLRESPGVAAALEVFAAKRSVTSGFALHPEALCQYHETKHLGYAAMVDHPHMTDADGSLLTETGRWHKECAAVLRLLIDTRGAA